MREQLDEQRALVGEDLRVCYGPFADHQDALAAGARQRDGVETARVEARLDVERQHAQLRREVGGLEGRVPVDAADARTAFERSRHRERALQTAVDQIAVGEAEVGLEALDPGVAEASAERRHVGGPCDFHARDPLASERHEVDRHGARTRADTASVGGTHEEVRRLAIIDDEHGLASLEDAVQMHLRTPTDDAVGRGQDEAALGHDAILPGASGPSQRRVRASRP